MTGRLDSGAGFAYGREVVRRREPGDGSQTFPLFAPSRSIAPRSPLACERFALSLLALALLGCGPVEYINQVGSRAPAALAEARRRGAEQLAPYEVTAAAEYLHEARVVAGHSAYQRAISYGRRAEELATRAESLARERAQTPARERAAEPPPRAPSLPEAPPAARP
jgi:hypothetical protein